MKDKKELYVFPHEINDSSKALHFGMTLRDYFAAKAMQGLLSSDVNATLEVFAKQSYKVADEMLKAREA